MGIKDIGPWLSQKDWFIGKLNALTVDSVCSQFEGAFTSNPETRVIDHDWQNLLFCASILAVSEDGKCQEAALRIAQHCINSKFTTDENKASAILVLDTLTNRIAINLAENRNLINKKFDRQLPFNAKIDWTRRTFEQTIEVGGSTKFYGNKFQVNLWNSFSNNDWISISAPTSAGKSFVVIRWISDFLQRNPLSNIVYLVPTRALIYQVENDFNDYISENGLNNVSVSSIPLKRSLKDGVVNLLVFTQERFQIFLSAFEAEPAIDVLVIDEAHKVGDSQRGVLLQQVIEKISRNSRKSKFIFISPLTENPGILLDDANPGAKVSSRNYDFPTVNQNLLWVSQSPGKPKEWQVQLCLQDSLINIGIIKLSNTPSPDSKRLPFVAHAIGGTGAGNIIYVNGAAEAEKISMQLYDLLGTSAAIDNSEIANLIDLAKKSIHPTFRLSTVLQRGIAFHYGNMPLLIRTEIENLFSKGIIRYLICTSTLVEGVNMSCKNIFLRGPKKGLGHNMPEEDFWNLAGRAGRWGKEFQGNVFCIDARISALWSDGAPPKSRKAYPIKRTTDHVLKNPQELIEYIDNNSPRDIANKRADLEYVFSYLINHQMNVGDLSSAPWAKRFSDQAISLLTQKAEAISERLHYLKDIVNRNPGISPLAMESLYNYFNTRHGNIEELIPPDPASDDAVTLYTSVFTRVHNHLNPVLGNKGRAFKLALLVTKWMRGFPLTRLIDDRIKYAQDHGEQVNIPSVIRTVLEEVEKIARFEAPKYLACYSDILKLHLSEQNRDDLTSELKDIGIYLEFGVNQQTQISLMCLGLSRTSAISLSELITNDSLSETDCIKWLKENPWRDSDFPEIVKIEINTILEKHN